MDVILFRTFSHVIILTWKVDPHTERGAGDINLKSPIKVIDARRDSGKARLIFLSSGPKFRKLKKPYISTVVKPALTWSSFSACHHRRHVKTEKN